MQTYRLRDKKGDIQKRGGKTYRKVAKRRGLKEKDRGSISK